MTNKQRQRVYRLERYLLVDRDKIYTNVRADDLNTTLSLIKEQEKYIKDANDITTEMSNDIKKLTSELNKKDKQIDLMADELVEAHEWFYSEFDNFTKEDFIKYFASLVEKE